MGLGGSKIEGDNEVWFGFLRSPKGRVDFPDLCSRRFRPNRVNKP
jgi:hypothetical protein